MVCNKNIFDGNLSFCAYACVLGEVALGKIVSVCKEALNQDKKLKGNLFSAPLRFRLAIREKFIEVSSPKFPFGHTHITLSSYTIPCQSDL
jgi:hypothetical protein